MDDGRESRKRTNKFGRANLTYWGYSICVEILFAYDESSFSSPENKLLSLKRGTSMTVVSFQPGREKLSLENTFALHIGKAWHPSHFPVVQI